MKDYLYYLFDENMKSTELSAVKEKLCDMGAKVKDINLSDENAVKKEKKQKRLRKYGLVVSNNPQAGLAAKRAKVAFCGIVEGEYTLKDFKLYPYRQILSDISLLPLLSQPYPYKKHKIPRKLRAWRRLLTFKQIRGVPDRPDPTPKTYTCKNCGTTYEGRFCPHCGQSHRTPRFEMANVFKNIISDFFNIEHGFTRNFIELFWRPGYMIRDYLKGRRINYHKPFQTIFVLATIYLIVAHLLDPMAFVEREEVKLSDLSATVNKLRDDYTDTDLKPWLDEIRQLTDTVLAIKKEEDAVAAEQLTDSILKSQSRFLKLNTQDSLFVVNRVRKGFTRSEDETLSEAFADEDAPSGFFGWVTQLSKTNMESIEIFRTRYYHEGTVLYSIGEMISDLFNTSKAVIIILMIPVYVFCAHRSFRTTLVGMRLNVAEYILVFTHFSAQLMWVQLFTLFTTQTANFNPVPDMGIALFLMSWDLKQLFNLSWKDTFKRTLVYMYGYALLFVMLLLIAVSMIGSAGMWVIYQLTH